MSSAFTVRLDDGMIAQLDRLAEKTDRTRRWLVNRAVQEYVALNAWQVDQIEAGVAAADRGDFATPDEVEAVRRRHAARR